MNNARAANAIMVIVVITIVELICVKSEKIKQNESQIAKAENLFISSAFVLRRLETRSSFFSAESRPKEEVLQRKRFIIAVMIFCAKPFS